MLVFIYRKETALQRQILGTCIHGIQLEKRAFQMEGSDARMNTIHTKEMRSQKNCLTQSLFILVLNFQGHFSGTPTQTFRIVAIKYCPQKGKKKKKKKQKTKPTGTSLSVQWLRLCLPMQRMWVQSLLQEDSTCHGATKPMRHNS